MTQYTTVMPNSTHGELQAKPLITDPADPLAPIALRSPHRPRTDTKVSEGPLEKAYLFWIVGASCDGCTIAISGATHPRVEDLLNGRVPGLPRVELVHTVLSVESGAEWTENLRLAAEGKLDAPYLIAWEGSIMDETLSGDGYWMGLGEDRETGRQITSLEWLDRMAPLAAATIAVGTCATWGGIPAAANNVTNAKGVMDRLGKDYRSTLGLPALVQSAKALGRLDWANAKWTVVRKGQWLKVGRNWGLTFFFSFFFRRKYALWRCFRAVAARGSPPFAADWPASWRVRNCAPRAEHQSRDQRVLSDSSALRSGRA